MVRQIPNNPTFRLVRNIYIAILILNAIAVLLFLIGAILCGVGLKVIDNAKPDPNQPPMTPEQKEQLKNVLKVGIAVYSIAFVIGLFKQALSWVAVLKYNTCCIITVLTIDILALFLSFGSFFAGSPGFAVLGFIGYILDISCLSYMYIQIRQYDMS
jgi:hypothetical protein